MTRQLVLVLIFLAVSFTGCEQRDESGVVIVVDASAGDIDRATAEDLLDDIRRVSAQPASVETWSGALPPAKQVIVVGTVTRHALVDRLAADGDITLDAATPGPRGGIWARADVDGRQVTVLAGSDPQGTQYAVYDYSRDVLGVDPLRYWTGVEPEPIENLDTGDFAERVVEPPKIPYLVYFENDVDELANLRKPLLEYDWETYTELIDALIRLRYNGIELFDALGRTEYYTRPAYIALRPDYQTNMALIDRMIDYAQQRGMLVQVDMILGRQFGQITTEQSNCWSQHKQAWIDTWSFFLNDTPLGKADIFALRPRNQLLDWPYTSSCDEDLVTVFNEVYAALGALLDEFKPDAVRVCTCYDDGMELFNEGFGPPRDFIVAWSDDGWGGFRVLPEDTRGYRFGTYMHAGFWLNHTVHDPYPEKVEEIMSMMVERFGADDYMMVNGQTFRPFMLNLEAYSRFAEILLDFDGDAFYRDWLSRYFDEAAIDDTVKALKKLHAAQFDNVGYVENLWEIKEAVAYLSDAPIDRPGRSPVPVAFEKIEPDLAATERRLEIIREADELATAAMALSGRNEDFYHDHIVLPIRLYRDLLDFETSLHQMVKLKRAFEENRDTDSLAGARVFLEQAKRNLETLYERRLAGDRLERFSGWYDPARRRPNNGFPARADLETIEANLADGWR